MKFLLGLLGLVAATADAAPRFIKLDTRGSLPVSVRLHVPEGICVDSHQRTAEGDTVTFGEESEPHDDLEAEIVDAAGRVLWHWDIQAYEPAPGHAFTVAVHPRLPLLLLQQHGYRYDWDSKLLFVRTDLGQPSVAEYTGAKRDVLPFLREAADFPHGIDYLISSVKFTEDGVRFACAPLNPRFQTESFLFLPDQPDYEVDAVVLAPERVVPVEFVVPDNPYTRRFFEVQQWRGDHLEPRWAELRVAPDGRSVFLDASVYYRLVSASEAAIVWQVVDPAAGRRWWTHTFVRGAAGDSHTTLFLPIAPSEANGNLNLWVHFDLTRHRSAHPALDYAATLEAATRDQHLFRAAQY